MQSAQPINISALFNAESAEDFTRHPGEHLRLHIPEHLVSTNPEATGISDALAVQRLITLANSSPVIDFSWESKAAERAFTSPSLYPILAVALCIKNATHSISDTLGKIPANTLAEARQRAVKHRLNSDMFADCQISLCADSLGYSKNPDFYDQRTGALLGSEDFEALVADVIMPHIATDSRDAPRISRLTVTAIISELFENAHIHGRRTLAGQQVSPNCIRGIIIRRVTIGGGEKSVFKTTGSALPVLELAVFDSGIGYYPSYTGTPLDESVSLKDEWRVVHECMKRHYDDPIPDYRMAHRGLGLYKVLRAIMLLHGGIEVRTGRVRGFRDFFGGRTPVQMEPADSETRPGMPMPVLMDYAAIYLSRPSMNEYVNGAAVKIFLPLRNA